MVDYTEIEPYLNMLVAEIPGIQTVWLIGSRVNPTSVPPRDWDLLVFADIVSFESLKNRPYLDYENIDVLVVTDGDHFEQPWYIPSEFRPNAKQGSLSKWNWKIKSENQATYDCTKVEDFDKGITRSCKGFRLYRKCTI